MCEQNDTCRGILGTSSMFKPNIFILTSSLQPAAVEVGGQPGLGSGLYRYNAEANCL